MSNAKKESTNTLSKYQKKQNKKKKAPKIANARLCFISRTNNTILSLTNPNGDTISQISCGQLEKNTRKSSPSTLKNAIEAMVKRMNEVFHVKTVILLLRGFNVSTELITSLQRYGIAITSIEYDTCVAYGGTRRPRIRRN